ncbi:NB-ARC domain-containing protein [Ruminococcus sp. zg-924]|uniref:protein kinase domain-containing protein n=1 Tax=Ruminococcus sp. zg-924 TaxID=2678505 RepID=UPI00210C6DC0|nr:NB-ARC domain-containing protein [Ruminococcus sp. zg-924]MCQ4022811.1 hypothetical protein [Ruminococcus sp. zg-924]
MSREIKPKSKLKLHSSNEVKEFTIEYKRGAGGSCVAYVVSFYEADNIRHRGILKEYCPAYLGDVSRNADHSIIIPDEHKQRFEYGLNDYRETYRFINNYISENEAASNYHPVQLGLYEGNNTLYTLSSYDYGKGYDEIKDDSIYSLVKLMISVTKAVEMYHNAGFVHCDIKPENIFVLDKVTELIKLFDYDSLLSLDDLKKGKVSYIPNPRIYYVPELVGRELNKIGIATDIFEIGAMFYFRLFGKAPTHEQMEHDSEFNYDEAPLMNGVSPKAKYEIEKLLLNTLQISVRRRYKSTKALLEQLNLILSSLDNKKPYLLNLPVWQPTKVCIERREELFDIHQRLTDDGFVFIKGMGGLGKSEITKMYVEVFKSNYHTIQFCKYVDSLKALVAAMPISGINDEDYDNIDELFKTKNKLLHQCDSNTLIIIDNFNVTYDKYLREFLPTNGNSFKVIFTTRCMPAADYYEDKVLPLPPLSLEDSRRLFYLHTAITKTPLTDEEIRDLVANIQQNTLLLVLIAKLIKRTAISINTIIQKLNEQELNTIDTRVFYEYDYSDEDIDVYNKINNHLHTVFSISALENVEKQTLLNMTLISVYGIQESEFIEACGEKSINQEIIAALISQGWIENNGSLISLHSIVSDVISEQNLKKEESYYLLSEHLQNQCYKDETSHISVLQKALATAKQLDRRYKTESEESQAIIAYLLGSIYLSLYRQKEAERYLQKALMDLEAIGGYESLPVVYNKLGDYEARFGSNSKAIYYYGEAINVAESLCSSEEPDEDLYNDISDAILGIAECYENNNELERAVEQYKKLLNHIIEHNLEFADGVIKDIIKLSDELGHQDDVEYYSSLLEQYETSPQDEEEPSFEDVLSQKLDSGEFSQARQEYEKLLSELREELGEESPYYKDIAQYRWVYSLLNHEETEANRQIAENMAFIESTYGSDSLEMAEFLSILSFQMLDNANFPYGIELAERAIQICEEQNQEQSYAYTKAKMDLISANVALGDYYAAGEFAKELDLTKYSGADYLSDIIRSVGLVYLELGFYDEMIALSNKVISTKNVDRLSKIVALEVLLVYHERKGEIEKAEYYLDRVKELIDGLTTLEYAKSYLVIYFRFLARIKSRKKNNKEALFYIDKAISLFENELSFNLLSCYQDRGVYNTYLNDYEEAEKDFEKCNEIVTQYNLSPKVNLLIYNNIALVHYKKDEYSEAEKYYKILLEIQPDIINPSNYMEALICQNYGWIEHNLDDSETAEKYIMLAIKFYESNDFIESTEYITAKYNLSLVYSSQNRYEENLSLLLDLYNKIDKVNESDYSTEVYICTGIVLGLLASNKGQNAYDFALKEDKNFAKKYGKSSIERIDYLQKVSGVFKYGGYLDSFEFLEMTRKLIKKAKLEKSVIQASQLNFVGVAFLDLKEDFRTAIDYFKKAKALLEELEEQENPLYELVCTNIKQAEDQQMDDLIKRMVDNMNDNN